LHQGAEIGRPSTLYVEVPVAADGTIGQVRVGGEAVRIITGEVTL
jgi:predicted PhzF superfamily epimerase YddE/YHI9